MAVAAGSLDVASVFPIPTPFPRVKVKPPSTTTKTTTTTTTTSSATTVVSVIAGAPGTFTFTLSTATQPKVVSDTPGAAELTVPAGEVTFNVSDPVDDILSHNFEVCSTPLVPAPAKTLPAVQKLPDSCTGMSTPVVMPGGASATLTVDFTTPGAYEYLSTANPEGGNDASSGMVGVLNVT